MGAINNEDGEPPAKRPAPTIRVGAGFKWNLQTLAAAADAVALGGKSPVSALNELGVRVAYSVLRAGGPAHCPSFHVAVTVADLRFEGWGSSKRAARAAAARACLSALLARAGRVLPAPSALPDFTSDDADPHADTHAVSQLQCVAPLEPAPAPPPHNGDQQVDVAGQYIALVPIGIRHD
ncbi:RISC-loading complex subunit TARBP2-like isoform X2 [Trichoplusia ni]|uniref:RISC-loading complex subunit TARBP2-like isoform X2 n=1 Tax=Trichoplusia ni TaxID=7111 RepID=A0A7E5VTK0_TRINI|nr:RISC-loading complex subunit TARBP2-like isoform X2 [Trichoplusia ni]